MDKNTVFAIALSVLVIVGFYFVQPIFFPRPDQMPQVVSEAPELPSVPSSLVFAESAPSDMDEEAPAAQIIVVETELLTVLLSNAGGDIISYKLKQHRDKDDYVDMVLPGQSEPHAFTIAFGDVDATPIQDLFNVNQISPTIVEFYQDFRYPSSGTTEDGAAYEQFRLTKRYAFNPQEYMFELTITLDGGSSSTPINFSGSAYTLGFGPQIGPRFVKLDNRYDYRNYYTYANGKRSTERLRDNAQTVVSTRVLWAAIAGKYFTFFAIPDATPYILTFSTKTEPGIPSASRLYLSRPGLSIPRTSDTFRFYLGPKDQKSLSIYDLGTNSFNLRNLDLAKGLSSSGFLAPLEAGLKWFLLLFYRFVPNYGVAIILLTLLVRILMFPLTRKSAESTVRMQALSPKIKELQEKYKDNPVLLNTKMTELYKEEGYNPLTGCLPMVLQFPLFFAMYNLFNNHFDLRGAMFIPRWIPDLSVPESIFSFAPFQLPFLGWSDIRLLPFIYVGSQLLSSKISATPDQQANNQMKSMLYIMPIMFFFILYNVPSGLLLYWIMTNVLTLAQQVLTVKYKKISPAGASGKSALASKKSKKR